MTDQSETPQGGTTKSTIPDPKEPQILQQISAAWSSKPAVELRYATRWSWLLVLYFLIGGMVVTTIGAFQYQEGLFKDVKDKASPAQVQAQLTAFREDWERHDALRQEQQDILKRARKALTDPERAQAAALVEPFFTKKLVEAMPAVLQPPLTASEAGKTTALLIESLREGQKKFERALSNREKYKPLTKSDLHNLLYLQKLAWMVPLGPRPISLATMPPGLLTFIITLTMGALGSVLYVTKFCLRSVIDGQGQTKGKAPFVRPLSWFLFRPLLGMMTALVMFIFIKTGQFSFSDASLSATLESGLNPYLISVLAILSGFMSWQALAAIERSGKKMFGWQAKRDRWAYGLEEALMGKTVATEKSLDNEKQSMADKLEVSIAQVEKWIAGEHQVNHRQQERIAQILGMDGKEARKLFTDIPAGGLDAIP